MHRRSGLVAAVAAAAEVLFFDRLLLPARRENPNAPRMECIPGCFRQPPSHADPRTTSRISRGRVVQEEDGRQSCSSATAVDAYGPTNVVERPSLIDCSTSEVTPPIVSSHVSRRSPYCHRYSVQSFILLAHRRSETELSRLLSSSVTRSNFLLFSILLDCAKKQQRGPRAAGRDEVRPNSILNPQVHPSPSLTSGNKRQTIS